MYVGQHAWVCVVISVASLPSYMRTPTLMYKCTYTELTKSVTELTRNVTESTRHVKRKTIILITGTCMYIAAGVHIRGHTQPYVWKLPSETHSVQNRQSSDCRQFYT